MIVIFKNSAKNIWQYLIV